MDAGEALSQVIEALDINAKKLSDALGYNRPEKLYKILRGESKSISQTIINDIIKAFPQVNERFLISFEGDVLKKNSRTFKDTKFISYTESNVGTQNISEGLSDEYDSRDLIAMETRIRKLEEEIENYKREIKMKDEIIQSKNEIIALLKK